MKNILCIGNGAREHAIIRQLQKSPDVGCVYCTPVNAGMLLDTVTSVDIPASDHLKLIEFVKEKNIHLTIVGPEQPIVDGISDAFGKAGLPIFAPSKMGSKIEASKIFAKMLCKSSGIKTPSSEWFSRVELEEASEYVRNHDYPLAVKYEGLVGGKGVLICYNYEEAVEALKHCFDLEVKSKGGVALAEDSDVDSEEDEGAVESVIVEKYIVGKEASFFALSDGKVEKMFYHACDYKKVGEKTEQNTDGMESYAGEVGLNTGGMGSYAPSFLSSKQEADVMKDIIKPLVAELRKFGIDYKGVIFAGLMVEEGTDDIYLLEFNCRFGDPETQSMFPLLKTDAFEVFNACATGNLENINIEFESDYSAVTVVLASDGYPVEYAKGKSIDVELMNSIDSEEGINVFHAGTVLENGEIKTSGGRVMSVTGVASGKVPEEDAEDTSGGTEVALGKKYARHNIYKMLDKMKYPFLFFRKDIAE